MFILFFLGAALILLSEDRSLLLLFKDNALLPWLYLEMAGGILIGLILHFWLRTHPILAFVLRTSLFFYLLCPISHYPVLLGSICMILMHLALMERLHPVQKRISESSSLNAKPLLFFLKALPKSPLCQQILMLLWLPLICLSLPHFYGTSILWSNHWYAFQGMALFLPFLLVQR